jgi:hypothetical protein
MVKKGYRGVSLKGEVAEMLREKAKDANKTLSSFLEEVLQSYSTDEKEVLEKGSTLTRGDLEEMKQDIKAVREVLDELRR